MAAFRRFVSRSRRTPTKAKVRLAGNVAIDDEDGFIPEAKKGTTMADYDISRGPYHAILDKMALARQAQTRRDFISVIEGWARHVRGRAEARLNRNAPGKKAA
jgi:hypothetical protein